MRDKNIEMLQDTLQILKRGSYKIDGKTVELKLSREAMETVHVLLPEDIQDICSRTEVKKNHIMGRRSYGCENMDAFAVARQHSEKCSYMFWKDAKPVVLVLNFANPVHPGGGARRGARAQEEDLCRKSSLLLSLESRHAEKYYKYNRKLNSYMGSDAMMFTPEVEIIRDEDGKLLEETVIVAVLTCAAPMITQGREGMSEDEYQDMVYNRIMGMLKCSAYFGYRNLVLGAWGCGAFGNDAHVISDLFYRALKEMEFNGLREKDLFRRIDFAVLDRTDEQYTFKEFYRNFSFENFYKDEIQKEIDAALRNIRETEVYLDKIRGSLFGGAVGDALGYPVEFLDEDRIFSKYGESGIREYELDGTSGKALISDDTQMTLFTANGILLADTRVSTWGIGGNDIAMSYLDWLRTQEMTFEESRNQPRGYTKGCISWLADVPELYSRRAPGNTCLSALRQYKKDEIPQNDSKGCGGIMRVAPLALKNYPYAQIRVIDQMGAEIAEITHKHSLGYMPAAVLVHIISRIVYPEKRQSLKEIVIEARDMASEIFAGDSYLNKLTEIIDLAVSLSENGESDIDNIHRIGEGWVAEETLGIAVYCSLRHQDDFSAGVTAAVNHGGDSDSIGAVTGNILGAIIGYEAIEEKWKSSLELADVILEMADDLCHGCQMGGYGHYKDPDWIRKYMDMRWKDEGLKEAGMRVLSEEKEDVKMVAEIQQDEVVMGFWSELMKENEDAFETDTDRIFLSMKLAFQCIDVSWREGWLAAEEFADSGCGIEKSEIPLWEYFRATIWIVVDFDKPPKTIRMMLGNLLSAFQYTGCQLLQGFVYLAGALMLLERERPERALAFFRFLVPDKEQEAFDIYFQPVLDQWKVK